MAKDLFRKKSLDKISSPESLNNYIKVATPSVWVMLITVVIILGGVIFWGIFGNMQSYNEVTVYSDGNETICYVPEDNIEIVRQTGLVTIGDKEYSLGKIPAIPEKITQENDAYVLHLMNAEGPVWVYRVPVDAKLEQSGYSGKIVTGSFSPIRYVIN